MKAAWALGAAFVAVVLVLVVFSVLATEMGSAERLSSTEKLDGIDVPTIGTVGDFPDPAHRHVINVFADGRVVMVGTRPATYGELVDSVRRLAALSRGGPIAGTKIRLSGESFVIRADTRSGWGHALTAVQACAEADADRVFFAVRHESDGRDGAIAVYLPPDRPVEAPPGGVWPRLVLSTGARPATPAALASQVALEARSLVGRIAAKIEAPADASTGDVLLWLDAALRSGAAFDGFDPGPPASKLGDPIPAPIRTAPNLGARWFLRRGRAGIDLSTCDPGSLPSVERVRGALAGTTRYLTYGERAVR